MKNISAIGIGVGLDRLAILIGKGITQAKMVLRWSNCLFDGRESAHFRITLCHLLVCVQGWEGEEEEEEEEEEEAYPPNRIGRTERTANRRGRKPKPRVKNE